MKLLRHVTFGLALSLPLLCTAAGSGGLYGQMSSITEPTPQSGAYLGYGEYSGAAISDDGKTALIGSSYGTVNSNVDEGKVYFYSYSDGAWTLTQEIDDPDDTASDYFGYTLALSGDGKSALIQSEGQNKVYLYTLSGGKWSKSHEFDDPNAVAGDYFGYGSLALSDDGKTAVIGVAYATVSANAKAGEMYIYSDASGTWKQVFSAQDPDNTASDYFSLPAAISADGSSVLVGSEAAVGGNTIAGKAYLYTLSNGHWAQAHEFDDPMATANDYFGSGGVSLSSDGTTAAIGAYGVTVNAVTDAGAAYVYTKGSGGWGTPKTISDPDGTASDYFSYPLNLSQDGTKLFIGDEATVKGQTHAGKAYIYALKSGSWAKLLEIDDPKATASDYFSYTGMLSGDGETLISSASYQTVKGVSEAGEGYIFQSPADLGLAMSPDASAVSTGQQAALELTVTNNDSAVTANNVTVTGTLPAGLTYASSQGANGSCTATGSTFTCLLASLGPGATWQPSVTVTASSAGTLKATASVSSNQPDPTSSNDSASASIAVSSGSGGGGGDMGMLTLGLLAGLSAVRRRRR